MSDKYEVEEFPEDIHATVDEGSNRSAKLAKIKKVQKEGNDDNMHLRSTKKMQESAQKALYQSGIDLEDIPKFDKNQRNHSAMLHKTEPEAP